MGGEQAPRPAVMSMRVAEILVWEDGQRTSWGHS